MTTLKDARINSVEVVAVIKVEFPRGEGIEEDPIRTVTQYWTEENQLLVEFDSWKNEAPSE